MLSGFEEQPVGLPRTAKEKCQEMRLEIMESYHIEYPSNFYSNFDFCCV